MRMRVELSWKLVAHSCSLCARKRHTKTPDIDFLRMDQATLSADAGSSGVVAMAKSGVTGLGAKSEHVTLRH